jgi:hypothetical protein
MRFWIRYSNFMLFIVNGLIKREIEKLSDQYLGLICDESLICRDLNSNLGYFDGSTVLSLFHVENHVCLSRGVQVTSATWRVATIIMVGVGDPV